jgi:quercetin dioxygenase-like cupin family protein
MFRLAMQLPSLLILSAVVVASPAYGADAAKVVPLLTQALANQPDKEVTMLTVEYAPGQSTPIHRHNAEVFVYVLEGAVMMGVQGSNPVRLGVGQTFHESPNDIHAVSRNASDSAPAKFVVFMIKDKGAPATTPVK